MADSFPKRLRLLRPSEFDRVFRARCSAADTSLILYAASNELGYPRLGLAVSRKVGRAVVRNRWKRVLRESFRLSQHRLPPLDYVCLPRHSAEPQLLRLKESLPNLAARLQFQLDKLDGTTAVDSSETKS